MSRLLSYTFPVGNASDVCSAQTFVAAGTLALNGNLSNSIHSEVSFLSRGYSRSISITSADATPRSFVITGFQNGVPINETLNKPTAATVYSVEIYDVVTSVSVNGAIVGVSVGTGFSGFFPLVEINLERDVVNYTIITSKLTAASIEMAVYGTISNISQNGHTLLNIIANDNSLFEIKGSATEDQWIYPTTGAANQAIDKFILIYVDGVVGDIGNSVEMTFVQI